MDDKLITEFKNGDASALKAVYELYYGHLRYFAHRLTGSKEEAEDIAAYSLGILLSRYQDFNSMANIKAFLYITVRNKSLKFIDHRHRTKKVQQDLATLSQDAENYILAEIVRVEFYQEMYQAIERLPPMQKKVIKLIFMEGLDTAQIANRLGMPQEAVRKNKSRALHKLRTTMLNRRLLPFILGFLQLLKLQ